MCGRFSFSHPVENLRKLFGFPESQEGKSRFNLAPTQAIIAVRPGNGEVIDRLNRGEFRACYLRWGLIPSWAKSHEYAAKMANARAETITEKSSFKVAFRRRRCLVPMTGYYEWSYKIGANNLGGERQPQQTTKHPFYFHMEDQGPFAVAAIWESWLGADGSDVETCSLVTTLSNDHVGQIHHRMPVILDQKHYGDWCYGSAEKAQQLMRPYEGHRFLDFYRVSTRVNNVRHDDETLIHPIEIPSETGQLNLF